MSRPDIGTTRSAAVRERCPDHQIKSRDLAHGRVPGLPGDGVVGLRVRLA